MIQRIEALRYKCLLDVSQELESFHLLVGPNASGKSTFLDVPQFLSDLVQLGLPDAVLIKRSPNFRNLVWMEENGALELAMELRIPEKRREPLTNGYERARYEVSVGYDAAGELSILGENLWLKHAETSTARRIKQLEFFPSPHPPREELLIREGKHAPHGWRKIVSKVGRSGNDYFQSETKKWNIQFRFGARKTALANLPEDEQRFPVATWVKRVLAVGIQKIALNSEAMRRPAPPGSPNDFQPDGSNLPRAVDALSKSNPKRFEQWVSHVRTALPDLKEIDTIEREEDKHRYLRVRYDTELQVPSWSISDGTLRLLALTFLAYHDVEDRVYLIEEPENGIHPKAVECVFQALSSEHGNQVFCASHSPIMLSLAEPHSLLCFARTPGGAIDVVQGNEHPVLAEWQRETDLGTLLAAGVLG